MPKGIYKRTKYHKRKIREAVSRPEVKQKHKEAVNKLETRIKNSKARKKNWQNLEYREMHIDKNHSMYGKHHSKKTKELMRQKALGRKQSKETKQKIREHHKSFKGCNHTEKTKQKMRENHANFFGKNNPMWNGGSSFEPYTLEFNNQLKELIRKRDDFECQLCGISENGSAHDVHHINYNKKDCKERNLITLCHGHNTEANAHREKWQFLFETLQEIRQI